MGDIETSRRCLRARYSSEEEIAESARPWERVKLVKLVSDLHSSPKNVLLISWISGHSWETLKLARLVSNPDPVLPKKEVEVGGGG